MATNLRGSHVVQPGFTAEYDRISQTHPFGIIVAGVVLWVAGTLTAIAAGQTDTVLMVLLLLSLAVGAVVTTTGARLGIRNSERLNSITRDVEGLRDIVVFDEDTALDEAVWGAAGVAAEYAALEDDTFRLKHARVRTAEQDDELAQRRARLYDFTEQIRDLLA